MDIRNLHTTDSLAAIDRIKEQAVADFLKERSELLEPIRESVARIEAAIRVGE